MNYEFHYPCRCLWREFSHITRTIPLRRIMEHLGQIFRTDERTFMVFNSISSSINTLNAEGGAMLFKAVRYPASGQIVGSKLNGHFISRKNLDEMHPHLAGYVRQDFVAVLHLDAKHGVRESFQYRALNFY
jgi:hypothetical protein